MQDKENGTKDSARQPASLAQEKKARRLRRESAATTIRRNVAIAIYKHAEAEQMVKERAVLEAEAIPGEGMMSRQVRRHLARRRVKVEARVMRLLEREEEYIRGLLSTGKKVEGAYPLGTTTNGDEFLWVAMEHLDLLPALGELKPEETYFNAKTGKEVRHREMHAPEVLNGLSLLSRGLGLTSGPDIQTGVLADTRWMALFGYAPTEVEQGYTRRSAKLLGKTRDGEGGRFEEVDDLGQVRNRSDLTQVRGVLSSQTLGGHERELPPQRLADLLNRAVAKVASLGLLPKHVHGVLDTTGIEVSSTFAGAGTVRRKVKVATKNRRPRTVEALLRGFKVWLLMDAETAIPLAMVVDTIDVADITLARRVVEQAQANVAGHAKLTHLAIDRGFLDGDFLWWLKEERKIIWTLPSKEKMKVTQEARALVEQAIRQARQGEEEPLETARRLAARGIKIETVSFCEHSLGPNKRPLVLANVDGLYETDFYGPGGASSSRVHSKKYRPTLLSASVVLNWPDRPRSDLEDEKTHDGEEAKGPVVILSPVPEEGRARYDRYDQRSRIENLLNRDGKQHFALGTALTRTAEGMNAAVHFSVLALLVWRVMVQLQDQAESGDRRSERLGIKRYRRLVAMRDRDKVLVYADGRFAIMTMNELLEFVGFLR